MNDKQWAIAIVLQTAAFPHTNPDTATIAPLYRDQAAALMNNRELAQHLADALKPFLGLACTEVRQGSGGWHAIYQTHDGLDYCREDAPDIVQHEAEARRWAQSNFDRTADVVARKAVGSYRLEKW